MVVTIRDVAERAGVSISTVSRVLNNTCPVKEDKRQRVEEAARALGYSPNQVARNLLKKETGGLGVLLPYVSGEFFSEFLNGIDRTTQENGYSLMISTSHRSLEEMQVALKGMHRRVDGLVIMAPEWDAQTLKRLLPDEIPVLLVNTRVADLPYHAINFDNHRGGYLATEYLLEQGHRRIAMLKGPERAHDAQERLRGYRDALRAYGVEPTAALEIEGDYSPEAGYAAAAAILRLDPLPTALFGANDQSVIALMGALRHAGLHVPESISVVGFDDIPSARYSSPPLSSIHVPIRVLGVNAIQRLVEIVREDEGAPEQRILPVELVVRQSTAPLQNAGMAH